MSFISFYLKGATFDNIQSGTTTIAANTASISVTINAVNRNKSYLVFTSSSDDNQPRNVFVGGRITNTTTLDFSRVGTTGSAVDISWQVIEFAGGGFNVEHGMVNMAGATSTTITLANNFSQSQKFPLISFNKEGGAWGDDDGVTVDFNGTNEMTLTRSGMTTDQNEVYYQIVRWNTASVQKIDGTMATGVDSTGYTLSAAIDRSKAFLITNNRVSGNAEMDDIPTSTFGSDSTISVSRSDTEVSVDFSFFAVEWPGVTTFERKACFGAGDLTYDMEICEVNTSKAVLLGGGTTDNIGVSCEGDDNIGASAFSLKFKNSTEVTMTRAEASSPVAYSFRVMAMDTSFTCPDTEQSCPLSDLCTENFIPLPILFSNIETSFQEHGFVKVNWTSANTKAGVRYLIQTTSDGVNFTTIYEMTDYEDNLGTRSYSHSAVISQNDYIRIVEINTDGELFYSDIFNVQSTLNSAYPSIGLINQFLNKDDLLSFYGLAQDNNAEVIVYSLTGVLQYQTLLDEQGKALVNLNSSGYYIATLLINGYPALNEKFFLLAE